MPDAEVERDRPSGAPVPAGAGLPRAVARPMARSRRRVAWVLAFAAAWLAWPAAAGSARPDTVFLEDLTWTEVRDALSAGTTTVIVPVGGTEQNGPHMTLGKHNARVRLLAERIARALGGALVAPVVAYVPEGDPAHPSGHLRFPGTISVSPAAFEQTLEWTARSFKLHGFRAVVLLGDHGGYQAELAEAERRVNRESPGRSFRLVACREYYRASQDAFADILAKRGYARSEIGRHAGLLDTSLQLALDPATVRTGGIGAGRDMGVDGDATRASAELGRIGAELIVSRSVEAIRAALSEPH